MFVNQDLIGKYGTVWQALTGFYVQRGRLQQQIIINFKPGPTAYATSRIIESSQLSSFRVCLTTRVRKCTVVEAHCILDETNRDVTLDKLDRFIGLIIARRIAGERYAIGKLAGCLLGMSDVQ